MMFVLIMALTPSFPPLAFGGGRGEERGFCGGGLRRRKTPF